MLPTKTKYHIKVFGMAILLGLSVASFAYLNAINDSIPTSSQPDIFVEDVEEDQDELMPDVKIIKMLMNKTLEFVTRVEPFHH